MEEKILTVPTNDNGALNAMAMMNNNPWMYLVMLALFGGGGFGYGNNGVNTALDIDTQNKLNSLQAQINDNNNNQWLREAIAGNATALNALKDCCCQAQKQTLEQGYQNQIQTINQTNDLQTTMRAESGLVRAEVASFRQAWENSRYQDVVAEKTRLQTELDLLRQNAGTAAMIAPVQADVTKIQNEVLALLANANVAKTATATTAG
jgi:hypothetical protein